MSARLKLKHMEHRIAMIASENSQLRYELSRLNVKWELIGARERLERIDLAMAPKAYLECLVSHLARALTAKMCENLEECIKNQVPTYVGLDGYDTLDVRLLAPRFTEASVQVTVR